ncbi:hypothetical protein RHSIM_Rhsim07G0182800 [Rhododendron simsii]|uniref:ABC transporter domain-containing protein n=1 Tax=Rhododendron simsii TaxID=118357 RepID=A0A834GTR2_RHOSS|nr:hypothetical protein RHSIM_Rhsim07G0182800 [Rhododendron simsii]
MEMPRIARVWISAMESFPGFALYRVFYEFSLKARDAKVGHSPGMKWQDLNDRTTGMKELLIIMVVEWFILLVVSYCIDKKSSLFRVKTSSSEMNSIRAFDPVEKADVAQERVIVEQFLDQRNGSYSVICDDMKKVYPGKDGNPAKAAVQGLSLALSRGECFGMLGPNGAGKSSFIKMLIGLTKPSSGTAYVEGLNILSDMSRVYTSMGVCPQHDLLWETLTGREHLLFYGRLKNLKGDALSQVVFMDEPSTGLDPASRKQLWDVLRRAKMNRTLILTTHSMKEAERLCDRLGILVDGSLQCIGNTRELKARYGEFYVFTATTPSSDEQEVERSVLQLSANANKTYHTAGTQKFELPKNEVKIADVFKAVEDLKNKVDVQAWGLVDTTLEDVFIKVARGAVELNVR